MGAKFDRLKVFDILARRLGREASRANHQPCGPVSGTPFHYEVLDKDGQYWVGVSFNANHGRINKTGADDLSSRARGWIDARKAKRWGDDKTVVYLMEACDPGGFGSPEDLADSLAERVRAWQRQFGE